MSEHEKDVRVRSWVRSPAGQRAPDELRRQVLDIPTAEPGERSLAPTGGTRTMFSATKLVGLAAAVALFGALMLAGPLDPPQEVQVPGAPAFEPGEITPYTGTLRVLGQDRAANADRFDWGNVKMGEQWTVRLEMSDPRMSGVSTGYHNVYEVGDGKNDLRAYTARLFTKEGSWLETGRGYQDPETTGIHYQGYLVGEGPYEGLFAVWSCGQEQFSGNFDCEGAIFAGGLPATPEAPPDEIPPIHGTP